MVPPAVIFELCIGTSVDPAHNLGVLMHPNHLSSNKDAFFPEMVMKKWMHVLYYTIA